MTPIIVLTVELSPLRCAIYPRIAILFNVGDAEEADEERDQGVRWRHRKKS